MDFTFDLNQIPVIGHKRLDLPNPDLSVDKDRGSEKGSRTMDNTSAAEEQDYVTNWAKPQLSQVQCSSVGSVWCAVLCDVCLDSCPIYNL